MAGIGATGIGSGFHSADEEWASIGWASRKIIYSDVKKYTHFDGQLPFGTAEGFVTLVHPAEKMGNLLL
jgi:hypothetical protein